MNISKKTRGAVSVFLVMILVPCIVVTSVFVDLGRVHMSKSMANSAADLALNSLLTNYDADLNEWYGMVTSCQNIEEFYEVSAQFFLRTISSQGLSDDEIYLLSDYYAHATNDDTIYDLLKIECQTAPSSMISEVSGANLTNATMVKDEVVEFMKYRAPIEITTQLINRLKSDSTVLQAIESEENKPLVDNKSDYYQAEGELLAAAFNSYVAIYDYYKLASTNNLTNDKLIEYANKINGYKTAYADIHNITVSNLINTSGLSQYTRVNYALDKYNTTYTEKTSSVYSSKRKVDGVDTYFISESQIESLINDLNNKITAFNTAKSNFTNAASSLMGNLPGTGSGQANTIQWWVQMNKAVNSSGGHTSKVKTAAEEMLKAYSKVLAIDKCTLEDDVPSTWKDDYDYEDVLKKVENIQKKYLKKSVTDASDAYLKAVNQLEKISSDNKSKIQSANLYVTVDGQSKSLDDAVPYIKGQLDAIRSDLASYVSLLNIAIDGNEGNHSIPKNERVKCLDKLLELAGKYNTSLVTWTNTANASTTSMGADDRQEISEIEQVCQEITEDSVRTLKTRLSNIRSQLNSIINAIDSMEYGNAKVKNIANFSTFKSKTTSKVSSSGIKLKNSEISSYASSTFSQLFKPTSSNVISLGHTSDANYNPTINPITKQVQTPELFIYFQDKFGGLSKQDVVEKQNELDSGKETGNNKADEAKEKGRYHGGGSDIAKDFSGSGTFNLADGAISGVMDLFESLINLDITSIRDDLYVTSYIMNMFSYATYENEGLYNLIEDKTALTLTNYTTKYNEVMGSGPDDEGKWLSAKPKDFYNKSLTNKLINKSNNSAYCAEVEYILYGGRDGKGNSDNVKSVYSNIYGIRYVLNLVSGFANFWSVNDTNNTTAIAIETIAAMIQGATGGIIPIPLTKVVLIPILTAFETAKDLDRLEAGFPVEVYKTTYKEWWISVPKLESISSFTSALSGAFSGPNKDNGLFYSDYLTAFVYLGLKSSSAEMMYQRMSEVIQANMRKLTNKGDYSMKKARLYFKLDAQIRVSPLMITLPFFNDDDYKNNMDTKTDWCTYTISTVRGYS